MLKPISARAETLARKSYYRDAFNRRRCLMLANGYYEWLDFFTDSQNFHNLMRE